MKFFNKKLFIAMSALLADVSTYTITPEPIITALEKLITSSTNTHSGNINTFDVTPYNFSAEIAAEKLTFQTLTTEDKITLNVDYENKESGLIAHLEKQLYPDHSLDNHTIMECDVSVLHPDSNDAIPTSDTSDNASPNSDVLNDLLKDSADDARRQEMNHHNTTQQQYNRSQQKFIREQDLQKNKVYFDWDFAGIPLDSDLMLEKPIVFHDPRSTLSSPIIAARFERLITFYTYKTSLNSKFQAELDFCKALRSGKVLELYNQIYNPHLPTAQAAFNDLKKLWIRDRKHMFLINNTYNTRELDFITKLGIDIMIKAERVLITRPDYLLEHADIQSLKQIQEYKEYCQQLQYKGDRSTLLSEVEKLRSTIKKRSNFTTKISLATAHKILFDPLTTALHEIAHTPSLAKACSYVKNLEINVLIEAQQQNIIAESQLKPWITQQYGFDLLSAAHHCYKSRPDYVYTPNNQSHLSDPVQPILKNIESKPLPQAHAELVHLKKQVDQVIAQSNISDPLEQQEYIKKSLGRDVVAVAQKTYKARSDHKKLAELFMDIDVNKATASVLQNNNTYQSVAHEMSDLAQRIFINAHHCNLSNLPQIESHVHDSIEAMRIAQDHPTFIFNLSMVNHTLGDLQQLAHAILNGTQPVLQRSSELLLEGFSAFFKGLNPITQISDIGHLASDIGSLLQKGGSALWNDPIAALHNGINGTFTLIDLIRHTADFTSDLTVGKLYLSSEEYKQRTDQFCAFIEPLKSMPSEQYFQFAGKLAADILITKGLGTAYNFLKEIDALEKFSGSTASVARIFKNGFDTHLGDNPVVITAEGVVFKMSNGIKDLNNGPREIINSSKALLESVYAPIADALKVEMEIIKTIKLPYGFAEFSHKPIRIAYKHILGLEIGLNKKGKLTLSGFHLDFKNAIEKNGVLKFTNKFLNKHGCYITDLVTDGLRIPDKTFFPAHWSRTEVINKINEAYNNFIKSGIIPKLNDKGKYMISGFTSEGIEIEMCFTVSGEMKTAYPIVARGI